MRKEFNTTGVCVREWHYMMDNRRQIGQLRNLVERGKYFTIHRPRQYGKTTSLKELGDELTKSEEYIALSLSFEIEKDSAYKSIDAFAQYFVELLKHELKNQKIDYTALQLGTIPLSAFNAFTLSTAISELINAVDKKVVLMIDEVDSISNYVSFVKFLALFRSKYLKRYLATEATFHSVILSGVHDVKNLKYKIHSGVSAEIQYNSPWNIAEDFDVKMSFNAEEIESMLMEYAAAESIEMDIPKMAKQLHFHTAGYPFLVSRLCQIIVEKIISKKNKKEWTLEDLNQAVSIILKENNTNFDSLIKNLEEHPTLYRLVYDVLINGENIPFNGDNPVINLGRIYGVFKKNGRLKIHNQIFEERIANYMISKTRNRLQAAIDFSGQFILPNNELDLEHVLLRFQKFMKMEHNKKDADFLERNGRLVFLSFLAPILNGVGHIFKEVQISEEKRLDVVVTYLQHKYIIELKRWYGNKYHQNGLHQLADYLKAQAVETGYLVIFEYNTEKSWRAEWVEIEGKRVFAIWV